MPFEQVAIKVEKEREFEALKGAINRAFAPENVEKYLKQVASSKLRIRYLDGVLSKGVLDRMTTGSDARTQELYSALTLTDQAQIKEFYLFKIEEVSPELRTKYHKLYQYY